MAALATFTMSLPAPMLQRGFWLYVWRVENSKHDLHYVGRTGDSSSPHATAPYTRMSQHLGFAENQNALRKYLKKEGLQPEDCRAFYLIAHGPIYPEIAKDAAATREARMELHATPKNKVAALEKKLADSLRSAGYHVMNDVHCRQSLDEALWQQTRSAFTQEFPLLASIA